MGKKSKFLKTRTVAVEIPAYDEVIDHILEYYGHVGKFFSIAGKEKKQNDLKKLASDSGND